MRKLMAMTALTLLGACGGVEPADNLQAIDAGNVAALPALDDNADAPEANGADAAALPVLNLATDGLAVTGGDGGAARALAFGTPRADVEKAVAAVLGQGQSGDPCPIAPLETTRYPGIDLSFSDDKLVGWTADPAPGARRLTTASGIGIGSTRTELDQAYTVTVEETSLGMEFNVDSFAGLLNSDKPDATITNLWAGQTCIAR